MPLHRDIHWLGRQWAVTGHGLQLINQKQMGYYDIEIARLWEPGVIEAMQSKAWIDRPDFDKAVEVALTRFAHTAPAGAPPPLPPAIPPPRAVRPPVKRAAVEPPASAPTIEELLAKLKVRSAAKPAVAPKAESPKPEALKPEALKSEAPEPEPPRSEPRTPQPSRPQPSQVAPAKSELLKPVPPPAAVAVRAADPAPTTRRKPAWPVFDRKIAGSGRFVRPWRARLTL